MENFQHFDPNPDTAPGNLNDAAATNDSDAAVVTSNSSAGDSSNWQTWLALGLLLLSVAGFVFFANPSRAIVNENHQKLETLSFDESSLQARLADLTAAKGDLNLDSEVKTTQLIKSIPAELSQDELIVQLNEIATKNDIQFQALSFGLSGDSSDEVKKVSISASFEGNYSSLIHFLEDIEQNKRKLVVDNISVQLLGEAVNGIERVHFSLSMIGFYRQGI